MADAVRCVYWLENDGLEAKDIDTSFFTHLCCAFAELQSTTYSLSLSQQCMSFPRDVRRDGHVVKTLLSIGGGRADPTVFKKMMSHRDSRKAFIDNSIYVARLYAYDGLDFDWEGYSNAQEMANMGTLLDEWREAVNAESLATGRQPLILTAAVSVLPHMRDGRAKLPTAAIAKSLDWVNVMAYDFYGPEGSEDNLTRPHASLYDPDNVLSGDMGIQDWLADVPREKLVLGLPFYGYAWKLTDANAHGIMDPSSGIDATYGNPGDGGQIAYRNIVERLLNAGAEVEYAGNYVTDYCYLGVAWVPYDNTKSISTKVKYARTKGLRGYFAWHVGQDDPKWTLSKTASDAWEE